MINTQDIGYVNILKVVTYHITQMLMLTACFVTVSYTINDDYEGGEVVFWKNHTINKQANSVHVYPSNFLYPHEVNPVTKAKDILLLFGLHIKKENNG